MLRQRILLAIAAVLPACEGAGRPPPLITILTSPYHLNPLPATLHRPEGLIGSTLRPPSLVPLGDPSLTPGHHTWLRATGLSPGHTAEVAVWVDDQATPHQRTVTPVVPPDGRLDLRLAPPDGATVVHIEVSQDRGARVTLPVVPHTWLHPELEELNPTSPGVFPGALFRVCVPEEVAGACPRAPWQPWDGTRLAALAFGAPLPDGLQAAICGPETELPGHCCASVALGPQAHAWPEQTCALEPAAVDWVDTGTAGRPFTLPGGPRVARACRAAGWSAPAGRGPRRRARSRTGARPPRGEGARPAATSPAPLDPALRAAIAAGWTAAGLAEHASIASFARFVLELLTHGAPAWLVQAATQAQADEVAHAQRCFTLAARFADHPVGPGELSLQGGLDRAADLAAVVRAAILEGCVNETLCAEQAARAARQATDPEIAAALRQIAMDEARHAELSWAFVAWALHAHPALRPLVAETFAHLERRPVRPHQGPRLDAWGLPSRDIDDRIAAHTLENVVRPCAAALLGEGAA